MVPSGLAQGKVGIGGLQDTKLTGEIYTRESSGFWGTATAVPSAHRDGAAVFYHEAEHFDIEELRLQGTNVISFQLVMGRRRWHIVG